MHSPRPRSFRLVIGWTASVIVVLLLLISCLLPSTGRARETANRVRCASKLRQIGMFVFLYMHEHRGQFPPSWPAVFEAQDMVAATFTCPSSDHDRATGPTTQAVIASMLAGDHLDYVWVGGGLRSSDVTPATVLAFDYENHVPKNGAKGTGINVLFGDGSVEFVDEPAAKAIWAQFIAGVRPIVRPPTGPPGATPTPTTGLPDAR